jgi:peptidoglycan/xylan/chitin deacetylase (PgdA/CDA1 family)
VNAGFSTSVKPSAFEEQMRHLADNFTVRKVSEIELPNVEPTRPIAVVTFDDGYEDNHDVVLPILEKYGLKATFFVCTGYVSGAIDIAKQFRNYRNLRPMDWRQVGRLRDAGMEIGAHSITHPTLSGLSRDRKTYEIVNSKKMLTERLKFQVESFAYPFGYPWTFDNECEDIVRREYRYCCTSEWGLNNESSLRRGGVLRLRRIGIDTADSIDDFIAKLHGAWDYLAVVQRARYFFRAITK